MDNINPCKKKTYSIAIRMNSKYSTQTWDVSKGPCDAVIFLINNNRALLVDASTVSQLSAASSEATGFVDFKDVTPSTNPT